MSKEPLYPRALRLRHLHPSGWQRLLFWEGSFVVAALLVLADVASAWTLVALPAAVAVVVKGNDLLAGLLTRAGLRGRVAEAEGEVELPLSVRRALSEAAYADFSRLILDGMTFAEASLGRHGRLAPFARTVGPDGELGSVSTAEEDARESLDVLYEGLLREGGQLRSVAVFTDVLLDREQDAIRVELEHSDGSAALLLAPYVIDKGRVELAAGSASVPATRRFWQPITQNS